MAKVRPGKGTLLQHGTGSPPTYTTVAQRVTIDGPEGEKGTRDTTDLDSAAKTYAGTLYDGGDLSGTLNYDPQDPTHQLFFTWLTTQVDPEPFRLQFNDGSSPATGSRLDFTAVLTKFKPTGMEVEGNLQAEYTLKVSGLPVFTAGS